MKKRNPIAIIVISAVLILIIIIAYQFMLRNTEQFNELSDLQAMRGAEATAMMMWKDEVPEKPEEYWYSVNTFELIETTEAKPAPYGMGTKRSGGGSKSFQNETGLNYEYSENEDYTDKVIHVVMDKDESGNLKITMNWE